MGKLTKERRAKKLADEAKEDVPIVPKWAVVGTFAALLAAAGWGANVALQGASVSLAGKKDLRDLYADMTPSGGWTLDKEQRKLLTSRCDIDRRRYDQLSAAEFKAKYRQKKPVVIEGFIEEFWPARNAGRWSRPSLMRFFGNRTTKVGSGAATVYSGGSSVQTVSLQRYLDDMRNETSLLDPSSADFNFDVGFIRENKELYKDFMSPEYFNDFAGKDHIRTKHAWHMLSLGPSRSGLPLHVHGETWLGLVYGHKLWGLYPPGKSAPLEAEEQAGFHPLLGTWEWFRSVVPLLRKEKKWADGRPLECMQRPGDILYLPAAWKHITMNVGEAIGVGGQAVYASAPRLSDALTILQTSPGDFEAHHGAGLGFAHKGIGLLETKEGHEVPPEVFKEALGHLDKSVYHFEQAIKAKPGHPEVHLLLAEIHSHRRELQQGAEVIYNMEKLFARDALPAAVSNGTLASVHLNAARYFMATELWDHAVEALIRGPLSLDEHNPEALADLGVALTMQGRFDEGYAALMAAAQGAPDDSTIDDRIEWALHSRSLHEARQEATTASEIEEQPTGATDLGIELEPLPEELAPKVAHYEDTSSSQADTETQLQEAMVSGGLQGESAGGPAQDSIVGHGRDAEKAAETDPAGEGSIAGVADASVAHEVDSVSA